MCPYEEQKSQSDSNMLLYNDLIAHSDIRALIPSSVFIMKQVKENGAKALILKVCFFHPGSQAWKGRTTLMSILRGASGNFELPGLFFN